MTSTKTEIEKAFAACGGRVIATLINDFGDFNRAEDVLQEAFLIAGARAAYRRASALSQNSVERAFFQKRLAGLTASPQKKASTSSA